jgi:hypothetical protein
MGPTPLLGIMVGEEVTMVRDDGDIGHCLLLVEEGQYSHTCLRQAAHLHVQVH